MCQSFILFSKKPLYNEEDCNWNNSSSSSSSYHHDNHQAVDHTLYNTKSTIWIPWFPTLWRLWSLSLTHTHTHTGSSTSGKACKSNGVGIHTNCSVLIIIFIYTLCSMLQQDPLSQTVWAYSYWKQNVRGGPQGYTSMSSTVLTLKMALAKLSFEARHILLTTRTFLHNCGLCTSKWNSMLHYFHS